MFHWFHWQGSIICRIRALSDFHPTRRRENMVGVNMVLALYPQNTLYHRIYIVHVWIQYFLLEPCLLQPCFHVAGRLTPDSRQFVRPENHPCQRAAHNIYIYIYILYYAILYCIIVYHMTPLLCLPFLHASIRKQIYIYIYIYIHI